MDNSLNRNARIAGVFYLLMIPIAPLRLEYIPSVLFVHANAAATAHNIATHQALLRAGMYADLLTATIEVFLVLALYRC